MRGCPRAVSVSCSIGRFFLRPGVCSSPFECICPPAARAIACRGLRRRYSARRWRWRANHVQERQEEKQRVRASVRRLECPQRPLPRSHEAGWAMSPAPARPEAPPEEWAYHASQRGRRQAAATQPQPPQCPRPNVHPVAVTNMARPTFSRRGVCRLPCLCEWNGGARGPRQV